MLTAAFKDDVKALFTAAVSGSVVVELVVLVGLISCSSAFSAVELKLAESELLPVPRSALTCWLAIVDAVKLFNWLVLAPFNTVALKLDGSKPAL